MIITRFIFWVCLALIAYVYLFYPVVLFISYSITQIRRDWRYLHGRRDRRVRRGLDQQLPNVSFLVAAYNEEECLPGKIANLKSLDYPAERLEVVIVSDGSTDNTDEILRSAESPRFRVVRLTERAGKANALNHAVAEA